MLYFRHKTVLFLIMAAFIFLVSCSSPIKVEIPRFPHNSEKHIVRELAVLYSPDDISASSSLADLGYPNTNLFLLHREHPQLKITMQTVPANRYLSAPNQDITTIVEPAQGICCRSLWLMIMNDPLFTSWMEIGNHGYSHSPPGDSNLDHHEFSASQSNCNIDHNIANDLRYCNERFQLARQAYQQIGLDNNKIIVMRFPGFAYTDAALRALLDNGFIAFFGAGTCGTETWVNLSDGRNLLEIPSASWYDFYAKKADQTFIDECVRQGGIINFFDHWWDMFQANETSVQDHYQIANTTLKYIEQTYNEKTWWPFGSELALWLYFKRNAITRWETDNTHIMINAMVPNWNPNWKEINISYSVTLPKALKLDKIEYSMDNINWHELNHKMYWQKDANLYLNVPFKGNTRIKIISPEPLYSASP